MVQFDFNTNDYDYGQQYIDIDKYKRNPDIAKKIRGHKLYISYYKQT